MNCLLLRPTISTVLHLSAIIYKSSIHISHLADAVAASNCAQLIHSQINKYNTNTQYYSVSQKITPADLTASK